MGQEAGSESSASKIEGPSGGGSTSVSDRREGDRDSGASQNPNTASEQVDCFEGTDEPSNRGIGVSGLQTTEAEGTDSKDDHTSGQAGPTFVAVSTGNDDVQQAPEEWTMVNHDNSDADTVEKREVCAHMEKTDTATVGKVGQKIVKNTELIHEVHQIVHDSLHLVDTMREKRLKNDPVLATVGGTEVKCTTDANEVHAQVRIEGSPEDPRASGQGSQSTPATVPLPDVVDPRPQGAQMLSKSGSAKEQRKQAHSVRRTPSKRETLETTTETIVCSNLERTTSTGGVIPSTGIVSRFQEDCKPDSGAANTVEADMSKGDPSLVSASGVQEEISEASIAPITAVLGSGPQEEGGLCVDLPRRLPRSESRKEALTSPKVVSKVSDSGSEEGIIEASKAPITVVLNSGSQEEGGSRADLPRRMPRSESRKEALTSPKVVRKVSDSGSEEGRSEASKAPITVELDPGSQEEGGSCADLPRRMPRSESRKEALTSPKFLSKVSDSGAEEGRSEASKAPITVVLDSGSQEEGGSSADPPRRMPRSESRKEALTSPKVVSKVSDSGFEEGRSEASKGPITVVLDSGSQEEGGSRADPPRRMPRSESRKEAFTSPKVVSKVSDSGSEEGRSEASKAPITVVLDSGSQEEGGSRADLPRRMPRSESRKEALTSPKAVSKVSNSGTQEESNEVAELSNTVMLGSGTQEAVLRLGFGREVSRSRSRKEVFTSPEAAGTTSGSGAEAAGTTSGPEAQGGSSVTSEASSPVPASEAICVVSDPKVQDDVHSLPEVLSPSGVNGGSVETEILPTESSCEVSKDVDSTSSESPNTSTEIITKPSTDCVVRNEVGDPSCRGEGKVSGVSGALSTVSALEAQKSFGTNPEENVPRAEAPTNVPAPEILRKTASQAEEENLQRSAHQSETTVSDGPEGLPRPVRAEGGEPNVPEGDAAGSDYLLSTTQSFLYQEQLVKKDEQLAQKDSTIKELTNTSNTRGSLLRRNNELFQALEQDYNEQVRKNEELLKQIQDLQMQLWTQQRNQQTYVARCSRHFKDLEGQLEQAKKECGTLQEQLSLYEQQHANEQSRGGSYLDDTKAATPALLVSALNGVKDASNNFVKVLKSSIQPGIEDELRKHIGAVSRNGHVKFQYQAYVCRVLFHGFDLPYTGVSKAALPPTAYFRHYQLHDMKKTDTVGRLLRYDPEIDPSLHDFCFDKFLKLMERIQHLLIDKSVDLRQLVLNKQHPHESKLYVSFCKLAVSVWLLQRLAFSFLQPAKGFIAHGGAPFDRSRMQSVVPLDEPSGDEDVQLRVGFYVLPGFDVGNSAVPCEVYVTALK